MMKLFKRATAFVLMFVMVIALVPDGVSSAAEKYTETMIVTDENVGELEAILANDNVKTVKLQLKTTKEVTLPSGDYSDKKLVVDSSQTKITNKATFDEVEIHSLTSGSFTEQGNGNCIRITAADSVQMVIDTPRRVASVEVAKESKGSHSLTAKQGAVNNVSVENTSPLQVTTQGKSSIGEFYVGAGGAQVNLAGQGSSRINRIEIGKTAGGAGTKIKIEANDQSEINSVTTQAADTEISVTANGEATVDKLTLKGDAKAKISGTSAKATKIDVSGATGKAQLTVEKRKVEIDSAGQDIGTLLNNKSGYAIVVNDSTNPTGTSDGSGSTKTPGSTSGTSSGSTGGSSGSGGGKRIETEPGNLIKNGKFPNDGAWTDDYKTYVSSGNSYTIGGGQAKFVLSKVGANAWDEMLAQHKIPIVKDGCYELKFTASSTVARTISVALANDNGSQWYGGGDAELTTTEQEFTFSIDMSTRGKDNVTNSDSYLKFQMGTYTVYDENGKATKDKSKSAASTIIIKNVSLKKTEKQVDPKTGEDVAPESTVTIQDRGDDEYFAEGEDTLPIEAPQTAAGVTGKAAQVTVTVTGIKKDGVDQESVDGFMWTMADGWAQPWITSKSETFHKGDTKKCKINLQDYMNHEKNPGHLLAKYFKWRFAGSAATVGTQITYRVDKVEIIDDEAQIIPEALTAQTDLTIGSEGNAEIGLSPQNVPYSEADVAGKTLQVKVKITNIKNNGLTVDSAKVGAFIFGMGAGPNYAWLDPWIPGEDKELGIGDEATLQFSLDGYYKADSNLSRYFARNFNLRFTGTAGYVISYSMGEAEIVSTTADAVNETEVVAIRNWKMTKQGEDTNLLSGLPTGGCYVDTSAEAAETIEKDASDNPQEIRVTIANRGTAASHVQPGVMVTDNLENGSTYTVEFDISCNKSRTIKTLIQNQANWSAITDAAAIWSQEIGPEYTHVSFTFTVPDGFIGGQTNSQDNSAQFVINLGATA